MKIYNKCRKIILKDLSIDYKRLKKWCSISGGMKCFCTQLNKLLINYTINYKHNYILKNKEAYIRYTNMQR